MAPIRHYLAYMRPRTIPVTFLAAFTGYAASPARPSRAASVLSDLALLLVIHSVLLWGGTNAFNSSQDRDDGPVNLLANPPPLPPGLAAFGLASKVVAIGAASLVDERAGLLVAGATGLSIFYSAKTRWWRRGKEIGVVDNLINAFGCGFGSILLGYVFTPAPLTATIFAVAIFFTLAIFGGIPTAQIFQLRPDDTYAHARNYASLLGAPRTLRVGTMFFGAHLAAGLAVTLAAVAPSSIGAVVWLGGWAGLVAAGAVHSWCWARAPFSKPYARMLRQLTLLMASQVCWTVAAWSSA